MKKISVLILALLILGLSVSWIVANQLVKPIFTPVGKPPDGLPAKNISLESKSGNTIAGWHVRSKSNEGVVVLLHGIRASRLSMLNRAKLLFNAGFSIVMIDLQSHGESTGEGITIGYLEKYDALAAVEYARNQHPGEKIGVIGVSLGGASILLGSPANIDALVIESVYPEIRAAVHNRVSQRLGSLSWLPAEILIAQLEPRLGIPASELKPIDFVSRVQCPIFVISGKEDQHTTMNETQDIYSRAIEPKNLWLVDGASHVDIYSFAPVEYQHKVLNFFVEHIR